MSKLDRIDPDRLRTNPRATFAAWLVYEPMIVAAMRSFPKPYVYAPTNMAPASVCSKARDAVRGMLAFEYPTDKMTHEELVRWYSQVIFKHDHVNVYIGSVAELRASLKGSAPTTKGAFSFSTLSFEEVSAFTLLLSNARILGPITITQPPDLSLLPQRLNVEMLSRPDGSLVLL